MKRISICTVLALVVTTMLLMIGCYDTGTLVQKDCVVMLGDSIFALSGEETEFLQELSGQKYRTYYIVGAQVGDPTNDDMYSG